MDNVILPDVDHGPLGSDRKSCAHGTCAGDKLDAERSQVEDTAHDDAVEEPDHFRDTRSPRRLRDELRAKNKPTMFSQIGQNIIDKL